MNPQWLLKFRERIGTYGYHCVVVQAKDKNAATLLQEQIAFKSGMLRVEDPPILLEE